MKKLNNKGMTTIEILLCFVLVAIISVSLYSTISAYNNKQNIESYKEKIYTYKNLLTKEIQDDIIKGKLIEATSISEKAGNNADNYTVNMVLKDGTKRRLYISRLLAANYDESDMMDATACGLTSDDKFTITYGNPDEPDGIFEYPIPDLGYGENNCGKKVKDLRINNVKISTRDGVLSIYIGFYHPELSTRYSIDIVAPINYSPTSASVAS